MILIPETKKDLINNLVFLYSCYSRVFNKSSASQPLKMKAEKILSEDLLSKNLSYERLLFALNYLIIEDISSLKRFWMGTKYKGDGSFYLSLEWNTDKYTILLQEFEIAIGYSSSLNKVKHIKLKEGLNFKSVLSLKKLIKEELT